MIRRLPEPSCSTSLSRRRFLTVAAGTVLVAACSDDSSRDAEEVEAAAVSTSSTFTEPDVLASTDGRLEVTLTASAATHESAIEGALAYNAGPVGPTLRVRPGDRIDLTLRNDLDVPTNLHTHGLNVSPAGMGDDVFATIDPGDERAYVYEIPSDHHSGTFWYHPHRHGTVAAQVAAGLFGAIIVDDEIDDRDDMRAMTERLLILNDPIGIDYSASPMDGMHGRAGQVVRVNGQNQPVLSAAPGSLERWRVVNASASRPLAVSAPGASLHVIASDGGRLGDNRELDGLVLVPGERAEIVVEVPEAPGEIAVGDDGTGQPLARLVADGSPKTGTSPPVPNGLGDAVSVPADSIDRKRTVTFGVDMGSGSMMSGDGDLVFTIDGKPFDPERTDITAVAGTTEEWTIVNTTGMNHPFHLHAWPFEVLGDDTWPGWKDTVNVPGGGEVTIRIPFVGQTGRSVYHCHILDHEDLGMMGVIDVQPA